MVTRHNLSGASKVTGTQTCYKVCPICHSQGWNFYVDNDTGKYYCFADQHCTPKGGVLYGEHPHTKHVKVPHEWKEITLESQPLSDEGIWYLTKRGIPRSMAKTLGIVDGIGRFSGRCIIPFFTKDMRLQFFSGRAYLPDGGPKYLHSGGPKPIYLPRLLSKGKCVCVVEGPFDAIYFAQRGVQSAAICGQSITPAQLSMLIDEDVEEIIVCLDKGCDAQAGALVNKLGMHFASVRMAQCPAKDPGEMTDKDFDGFFKTYLSK